MAFCGSASLSITGWNESRLAMAKRRSTASPWRWYERETRGWSTGVCVWSLCRAEVSSYTQCHKRWANADSGPTLNQCWFNVSCKLCFLGTTVPPLGYSLIAGDSMMVHTQFCETQWRHLKPFWMGTLWKQCYKRPPCPPYFIILSSLVTTIKVKAIEFYRMGLLD